jgi:ABC-type glycerol-3-phosphate transport system substrate-binding protein
MKIKVLISVFSVLFALTACSGEETLHFKGESDNWNIDYVTNVVASDSSERGTIKITYVGENEAPKQIDYMIKGGSGKMSGDTPMQADTLEIPGSNCSGCAVTRNDDEFDVTIEWDGKSESFTLENED